MPIALITFADSGLRRKLSNALASAAFLAPAGIAAD